MDGDCNDVLGLLMKYPKQDDVTPIMDLADMLRRGVLSLNAHIPSNNYNHSNSSGNNSMGNRSGLMHHHLDDHNVAAPWINKAIPVINSAASNMSKK